MCKKQSLCIKITSIKSANNGNFKFFLFSSHKFINDLFQIIFLTFSLVPIGNKVQCIFGIWILGNLISFLDYFSSPIKHWHPQVLILILINKDSRNEFSLI